MILDGHPSIFVLKGFRLFKYTSNSVFSDTSAGMLIWNNLVLDLHEISKSHINPKSNYSRLTLE